MNYLGKMVMSTDHAVIGMVLKEDWDRFAVYIRFWNPKQEKYSEGWIRMGDVFQRNSDRLKAIINVDDPEYWSAYHEASIDLALQTRDAEWFAELSSVALLLKYF